MRHHPGAHRKLQWTMGPFTSQLESALATDVSTEQDRGQMSMSMGLGGCVQWDTRCLGAGAMGELMGAEENANT